MMKKLTLVALTLISITLYLPTSAAALDEPPRPIGSINLELPDAGNVNHDDSTTTNTDRLNLGYLKSYLVDSGKIVAMPLHWDSKDWFKVGLVLGATSSFYLLDSKIKNFSQKNQNQVASKFATVGNDLGSGTYTLPAVGAFYLYGHLADDHKARRTSLLALESFALSGLLTEGLKVVVERHRPNTGHAPDNFDGPHLKLKNLSFSSGHTASSFSIATVFAEEYKDTAWVPPVAYGLATLTGLSRIYTNAHWSSDVFFGAVIGYFMSKAVLKLHKEDPNKSANRLSVFPTLSKEMTGLTMKYDF